MKTYSTFSTGALLMTALLLPGCINPLPASLPRQTSDDAALALLAASAEAYGGEARFAGVSSISVSYDGQWLNKVWKVQPTLVDREHRKSSVELIEYGRGGWPIIKQTHTGPAPAPAPAPGNKAENPRATKQVLWPAERASDTIAGGASVLYDGQRVADDDERVRVEEAAAMVAEAYRMFLTGPFYFTMRDTPSPAERREALNGGEVRSMLMPEQVNERRGKSEMVAVMAEPTTVQGASCDQILVELRPGFGTSEQDRVLIAIDQDTKYIRRVRFSLEGFRKTQGATADVEMSDFREFDGLIFPHAFLETVVHPIHREVHRWHVTELGVSRSSIADKQ